MAEKKVPLRRCAGCNRQGTKSEFVRIVRTPEGKIVIDKTGKQNGRGVYLCNDRKCLEKIKKNHRPDRSFGKSLPDEIYEELGSILDGEV